MKGPAAGARRIKSSGKDLGDVINGYGAGGGKGGRTAAGSCKVEEDETTWRPPRSEYELVDNSEKKRERRRSWCTGRGASQEEGAAADGPG